LSSVNFTTLSIYIRFSILLNSFTTSVIAAVVYLI